MKKINIVFFVAGLIFWITGTIIHVTNESKMNEAFNNGTIARFIIKNKTLEPQHAQTLNYYYNRVDIKNNSAAISFYTDLPTFNLHPVGDTIEVLLLTKVIR